MFIYNLLITIFLPLILLRSLYKSLRYGENVNRLLERIALNVVRRPNQEVIMVHAVSVGEIMASRKFVEELSSKFPKSKILFTCTTPSGSETIKRLFKETVLHQYLPIDHPFLLEIFLKKWQPKEVFLIEKEIWPNLINKINSRGINICLVNGRISKKSFNKYKFYLPLMGKAFSKFKKVVAQGKEDEKRFLDLGVRAENCSWDYSFKFDSVDFQKQDSEWIKPKDKKIILCASTHPPEEKMLLEAFDKTKSREITIVLVPRHPDRTKSIKDIIESFDLSYVIFSKNNFDLDFSKQVILVDTIGNLESLYAIADIAFIGGTLINHGGQNFLEGVKYGIPLTSGTSTYNFLEISKDLQEREILTTVSKPDELIQLWEELIENSIKKDLKEISASYLSKRVGASQRTLDKILGQ